MSIRKKPAWKININKTNIHISHPTNENNKNHDMTLEIRSWFGTDRTRWQVKTQVNSISTPLIIQHLIRQYRYKQTIQKPSQIPIHSKRPNIITKTFTDSHPLKTTKYYHKNLHRFPSTQNDHILSQQ